jgi:hypothetical protein
MPGIEQRFHSRDRRLASLTYAARRIGGLLNHAAKFMAPPPGFRLLKRASTRPSFSEFSRPSRSNLTMILPLDLLNDSV